MDGTITHTTPQGEVYILDYRQGEAVKVSQRPQLGQPSMPPPDTRPENISLTPKVKDMKKNYQTPEIQVIEARIEKGFQLSGLDHSDHPGTSDIEGIVETSSIYC